MKQLLFLLCFSPLFTIAQNIGIGTTEPVNKLHVIGSLLINEPSIATNAAATPAQIVTLLNNYSSTFAATDSTGIIYDPGGPAGNYIANLIAYATITAGTNIGFELDFSDLDLNTGDSLIIKESQASTNLPLYAVGNGYNFTGKITINGPGFYLIFKSNSDANIGRGFNLLFKRLYSDAAALPDLSGYAGKAMFYDAKKGALRAGNSNNSYIGINSFSAGLNNTVNGNYAAALGSTNISSGLYSFASGYYNVASGQGSIAIGMFSKAYGSASTAMGYASVANNAYALSSGYSISANGIASTAIGYNNVAGGDYSFACGASSQSGGSEGIAMGFLAYASGNNSISMGSVTTASGNNSIALGNHVSTSGFSGAFVLGDNSTTTTMGSFVANGFRSRFAGGYRLLTNSAANLGVVLVPDATSWGVISDVRLKENFLPVNGENFLNKIASMPLTTWNYKAQTNKGSRHYGPMAQDFYKAFGKDELGEIGCDTLINQQDFLGVNLIAIQALEKRTAELKEENIMLKNRLDKMEKLLLSAGLKPE